MSNTVKCRHCGNPDVTPGSGTRRHLWAAVPGLALIAVGVWLTHGWLTDPVVRQSGNLFIVVVPALVGFSVLGFGLRAEALYTYACGSCKKSWRRSFKVGPEEGDDRRIEWQLERLATDHEKTSAYAASWLGEHREPSAVEPLIKRLTEKDITMGDARVAAAEALAKIGDESAVEPLIEAAGDTSWKYTEVAAASLTALSEFEDPRIRGILETAAQEEDLRVKQAAEEALVRLG